MRHFGLLSILALVACSVVAVWAASASALEVPQNLPLNSTTRTNTGKSTTTTLLKTLAGKTVECASAKGEGNEAANTGTVAPHGEWHISFEKCKGEFIFGSKVSCTGLGDSTEIILALGTYELVFDQLAELKTAILYKIGSAVHFVCGGITLVVVQGSVLCLDTNPTVKTKTHEFACKEIAGTGDPSETAYWTTEKGAQQTAKLESAENEKAFESASQNGSGTVETTAEIFGDI